MESANKINTMAASAVSEDEFKKVANKVSFITIVQNVLLSVFKLFAGIFAHSNAMISDAVHSASDVFSTIIVIIGVKLASKESDKEHISQSSCSYKFSLKYDNKYKKYQI